MSKYVKNKTFYNAFKIEYKVIVRELVTDVFVGIPSILNGTTSDFKGFKALWDTGATCTVITKNVVDTLKLKPIDKWQVFGLNSKEIKDVFIVNIGLPNKVLIQDCSVIESSINSPGIDVLIGMDIIQAGDFCIANANNKTTFSYCIPPHKNPIDLYAKSIALNPKIKR